MYMKFKQRMVKLLEHVHIAFLVFFFYSTTRGNKSLVFNAATSKVNFDFSSLVQGGSDSDMSNAGSKRDLRGRISDMFSRKGGAGSSSSSVGYVTLYETSINQCFVCYFRVTVNIVFNIL